MTASSSLLPGLSAVATPRSTKVESVIVLWMGGGVTHIDSLDPKPDAPEEIRGTLGTISTRLPGVQFSEVCPGLASVANELSVIRSFSHDSNDHLLSQVYTLSGRKVTQAQLFSEPNIGSVISHLHGPRNGFPAYIAVPGITRPGPPPHNLFVGGWLGAQHAPFSVGGKPEQPDFTVGEKEANPSPLNHEDLRPRTLELMPELSLGRLSRRRSLQDSLGMAVKTAGQMSESDELSSQFKSAFNMLMSVKVRAAFDVADEPQSVREQYGMTKIGARCLLARRLVEAGARYVMVDYGYDPDYGNLWDNHNAPSQNFPHISEMCARGYHVAGVDRAFAGLLSDMRSRGLLDRTLVLFMTEFGRTPKINPAGGRDHWGACGSIFFAGAGVKAGQVVGSSDKHAAFPTSRGFGPADVAATVYQALGVDPETRLMDNQNRPVPLLDHGEAIPDVLG